MSALKVWNPTTLAWQVVPTVGPMGPSGVSGPTGPIGPATVIIGDFGAVATPADLPVDGLLPVDWDGPGNPAAPQQVTVGESLYYDAAAGPGDPLDGHLYQYVSVTMDPTGWIDIGLIQGPAGVTGPTGVSGVVGPSGVTGVTGATGPPLPVGGAAGAPLTKIDATDQNVQWGGDVVMGAAQTIQFPQEVGDKIIFYPPSGSQFKVGVESGEMRFTVDQLANRVGYFVGGTERVRITKDGVIAMGAAGLHVGDAWHGWAYASNQEQLRSYQAAWSFRKTNGSVPGTEVALVNEAGFWHGPTLTKLQKQILQNGGFSGPWDGEGTAAWTVNLTAGAYIFLFSCTAMSSSVGSRQVDLKVDGTIEASARIWINQTNVHTAFNLGIGTGSYSAGNHVISIHNGGSVNSDVNDWASVLCIPF